jgi:hypothetical protein
VLSSTVNDHIIIIIIIIITISRVVQVKYLIQGKPSKKKNGKYTSNDDTPD